MLWIVLMAVGVLILVTMQPVMALAAWTPLVNATDFTGINTDLGTTVVGILSALLIVLGAGILMKMFMR